MADIIITGLSDQDIAVLSLCAKLRSQLTDGKPDWKEFYAQHNRDAYSQIKQEIGTLVADNPEMATQMLSLLSDSLTKAPEPPENGASNGVL